MTVNFRSDNETPVAPAIMEALIEANHGTAFAYANDDWTNQLNEAFSDLFRSQVTVLSVSTGTVANAIALATITPPWGIVFCHSNAHILRDESGAPEFFGNGLRLVPVGGKNGKIDITLLEEAIKDSEGHGIHSYVPSALSLTQSTETGTTYSIDEITALCEFAHGLGMKVHMDGARFANSVASLGCHPAEISVEAGVDLLSFGASKNGCMSAEALVIFDPSVNTETTQRLRKRSGHLLSKMRYVSAQLLAYIENNLWLHMADHANRQAAKFAACVDAHPQARLEFPVQANKVLLNWSEEGFKQLEDGNVQFLPWPGRDDLARLVFGYSTTDQDTLTLIRVFNGINV